jgi:hypothetical protein
MFVRGGSNRRESGGVDEQSEGEVKSYRLACGKYLTDNIELGDPGEYLTDNIELGDPGEYLVSPAACGSRERIRWR